MQTIICRVDKQQSPTIWLFHSGLFVSDDQNIGALASASVLPMNIQGWFPLLLTGLITYIQYSVINHNGKECLKECIYIYLYIYA